MKFFTKNDHKNIDNFHITVYNANVLVFSFSFMSHIPVLQREVLSVLDIRPGNTVIDGTFGGGGHTKAILDSYKDVSVVAIDRDPDAEARAYDMINEYSGRLRFILSNFSKVGKVLESEGLFDRALFDFGISSFQVDDPSRGFSFSKDGALDMRMSKQGFSAYDVVNSFLEEDLEEIIRVYGDERKSIEIAANIAKYRKISKIETTFQLRHIVHEAIGVARYRKRFSSIDSATKSFQAIRIFVNDELKEIDSALRGVTRVLNKGARIVVISFHELEDRIVKGWAREMRGVVKQINRGVIRPSAEEIKENPRSRSAVLRGFSVE